MTRRTDLSKRSSAGFFSSARSFSLPLGRNIDPKAVRGYPIDMRVKTTVPLDRLGSGDPQAGRLYVDDIQWGLGCYERFLMGDGDDWLRAAEWVCEHLCETQDPSGRWIHPFPARHTWPLGSGWPSGMAQGEGASLLVRLALETENERFHEAAIRAMQPFAQSVSKGGVRTAFGAAWIAEEYPTTPASCVLNGAVFALWGMRDVAVGLNDKQARELYEEADAELIANLSRWDLGWWSRYSLFPHPLVNVASSFYHDLHVTQLRAMDVLHPRCDVREMAERFEGYATRHTNQVRAFAWKAAFRLAVPRNPRLAFRMPWFNGPLLATHPRPEPPAR